MKQFNLLSFEAELFPEVGSRLFQRIAAGVDSWVVVQEGIYRYFVSQCTTIVRIVIDEFLFAEVIWDNQYTELQQ